MGFPNVQRNDHPHNIFDNLTAFAINYLIKVCHKNTAISNTGLGLLSSFSSKKLDWYKSIPNLKTLRDKRFLVKQVINDGHLANKDLFQTLQAQLFSLQAQLLLFTECSHYTYSTPRIQYVKHVYRCRDLHSVLQGLTAWSVARWIA